MRYLIMANKITKREVINTMLADVAVNGNEMYVSYLTNELALLDKKASSKKATKTQEANVGIKATILEVLGSATSPMTVTEMMNANSELKALSNQKVSALVRQLVDDLKVVKTIDKKVSRFGIAEA